MGRVPHPRRSALGYIMERDVEKAVNETKLWHEWSCLPGGTHKAKITMTDLKVKFTKYVKKGGRLPPCVKALTACSAR